VSQSLPVPVSREEEREGRRGKEGGRREERVPPLITTNVGMD